MPFEPIAIVGAGAIFPGSLDVPGFWQNVLAGRDLLTEIPKSHWLIEDYYDADPKAPDKTTSRKTWAKTLPAIASWPTSASAAAWSR